MARGPETVPGGTTAPAPGMMRALPQRDIFR
jgi:hypothetical protein